MKIAIVHDALDEFGGAERFLQVCLRAFPHAHIYTAYYDVKIIRRFFPNLHRSRLHTTWVQNTFIRDHSSLFQLLSPFIWNRIDLEQYDIVLTNSAYKLSTLVRVKHPKLIHYVQSPPKNLFNLEPKTPFQKILPYDGLVQRLYVRSLQKTKFLLTNSRHMQRVMTALIGLPLKVIYPPVTVPTSVPSASKKKNYFLIVSRIDRSKSLELAIHACNTLREELMIVGKSNEDAYLRYLKHIAGPTVHFLGFKSDQEVSQLYYQAKGFLFTSKNEDFGIAPVEAMAHGVPIIAYYGGGIRESVVTGRSGLFFHKHTSKSLVAAMRLFQKSKFNSNIINTSVKKFQEKRFIHEIRQYVHDVFLYNNL